MRLQYPLGPTCCPGCVKDRGGFRVINLTIVVMRLAQTDQSAPFVLRARSDNNDFGSIRHRQCRIDQIGVADQQCWFRVLSDVPDFIRRQCRIHRNDDGADLYRRKKRHQPLWLVPGEQQHPVSPAHTAGNQ